MLIIQVHRLESYNLHEPRHYGNTMSAEQKDYYLP